MNGRKARQTILVAMSGGVDSSVAAALLVEQGHEVVGVTMKTFCYAETPSHGRTCCGLDGIRDARSVADRLGIPHHVFDMEESFTRDVIDDFVHEYSTGRTPNPCVRCNSNTKIPHLLRKGRAFGASAIATGHYARIRASGDRTAILRGRDRSKDQSYFLWGVPAGVLPALRFPVGALSKAEVREIARSLGLTTAEKPESQEICFVPDGDYAGFLAGRLGEDHESLRAGRLVTTAGEVVGTHQGYARYTVGQRRGLGGGRERALYVLGVRPAANEVVVGEAFELLAREVVLDDLNWIAPAPRPGEHVEVQIRHRAPASPARVLAIDARSITLELERPARAITPGQSGVLYRDEELVGGGRIRC
ncbi:MAG: tRNA 2-thiouridine(34) synthase MnmA [Gemmatimonadetes bacterium]|nr:tRNA 2-thiouridine(34) synthase MnmA [Gemmatimonadota bacterium]